MKKNHEFKWFEEVGAKFRGKPLISIMNRGGISFNTSFMRKNFPDGSPKFVKMGYEEDSENRYIAFLFTNEQNDPGIIKITYPKPLYGWMQCSSFFHKYKIDYKTLIIRSFEPEEYEDKILGRTFVITIKKQ